PASPPNSNHDLRGAPPPRFVPIDYALPLPNLLHTRFADLLATNGEESAWTEVVVKDSRNTATIISQLPGTVCEERTPLRDEWSVILAGHATVHTPNGDLDTMEGDIVLAEPGTTYTIETTGNTPSIRILVTDTNAL
ncbi:MAG: hypothetical protein OXE50_12100, partial [Chloroflexi bacterium]|nr:hypothetical protein [Chloroflexota bacterium]